MLRKTPQFELYDDLLTKHRVSQQDYEVKQTSFAKQKIAIMETEHLQVKKECLAKLEKYVEEKQRKQRKEKAQKESKPIKQKEIETSEQEKKKQELKEEVEQQFKEEKQAETENEPMEMPF